MAILEIRRARYGSTPKLFVNGVLLRIGSPDFSTGHAISVQRQWKRGKEKFYVTINGKRIPFNMLEGNSMSPSTLLAKYERFLQDQEEDRRRKQWKLQYAAPLSAHTFSFGGGYPSQSGLYGRVGRSW